ncbi:MAG: hypothetical protein ACI4E0_08165 [Blautia sp.]
MKKSYRKPLVYCENHDTGAAVSNSEEYEQEMKRKLAEMGNERCESNFDCVIERSSSQKQTEIQSNE